MPELADWDTFYVIVGGSAGALIGLQFVVLTLIAEKPSRGSAEAGGAFATPTIVHFSAALLLSMLLRAPWRAITTVAVLWALVGLAGTAYVAIIVRRMRAQGAYRPQLEDWLFHVVLTLAAYLGLVVAGLAARSHPREALFGIAAAASLLLFVGIHNAWDAVTYYVYVHMRNAKEEEK